MGLILSQLGKDCCAALAPTDGSVFMLGSGGYIWCLPSLLFLQRSSHDPCLSRTCYEMSTSFSFPSVTRVFQTASSLLYLCGPFVLLSLLWQGLNFLMPTGLSQY